MSYCVALKLTRGLIFMSDTLTNGGVDNISCYPKTFRWGIPGKRQIFLATAGNLATTQAVISTLSEQTKVSNERNPSILQAPTMFQVARVVSQTLAEVIGSSAPGQQVADSAFSATMILGGQIQGGEMRLYLIYPEGNFIEVSESNPFFQIGETKYGRPILVRAFDPEMEFSDAVKLLMVSFDSTIKANLSVGLPLDIRIYDKNSLEPGHELTVAEDDPYYQMISRAWGEALKTSLVQLPDFDLDAD
ncbi:MAG: peptidase [Candidatus Puniceispirillaceae bacterium]